MWSVLEEKKLSTCCGYISSESMELYRYVPNLVRKKLVKRSCFGEDGKNMRCVQALFCQRNQKRVEVANMFRMSLSSLRSVACPWHVFAMSMACPWCVRLPWHVRGTSRGMIRGMIRDMIKVSWSCCCYQTSSFLDVPCDGDGGLLAANKITDDLTAWRGNLIRLRHRGRRCWDFACCYQSYWRSNFVKMRPDLPSTSPATVLGEGG